MLPFIETTLRMIPFNGLQSPAGVRDMLQCRFWPPMDSQSWAFTAGHPAPVMGLESLLFDGVLIRADRRTASEE